MYVFSSCIILHVIDSGSPAKSSALAHRGGRLEADRTGLGAGRLIRRRGVLCVRAGPFGVLPAGPHAAARRHDRAEMLRAFRRGGGDPLFAHAGRSGGGELRPDCEGGGHARRRRRRPAGVLPRGRDDRPHHRFPRAVADAELERQVHDGRLRRPLRRLSGRPHRPGAGAQLRGRHHRHGPQGLGLDFRLRQSPRAGGFRLPLHASHGGAGQAGDRRLLRPPGLPQLLLRLLHRRASGDDRGAALPRRLRRDNRRRPRLRRDRRHALFPRMEHAGGRRPRRPQHRHPRDAAHHPQGGARRLRRAGRAEGRPAAEPAGLPVRP